MIFSSDIRLNSNSLALIRFKMYLKIIYQLKYQISSDELNVSFLTAYSLPLNKAKINLSSLICH